MKKNRNLFRYLRSYFLAIFLGLSFTSSSFVAEPAFAQAACGVRYAREGEPIPATTYQSQDACLESLAVCCIAGQEYSFGVSTCWLEGGKPGPCTAVVQQQPIGGTCDVNADCETGSCRNGSCIDPQGTACPGNGSILPGSYACLTTSVSVQCLPGGVYSSDQTECDRANGFTCSSTTGRCECADPNNCVQPTRGECVQYSLATNSCQSIGTNMLARDCEGSGKIFSETAGEASAECTELQSQNQATYQQLYSQQSGLGGICVSSDNCREGVCLGNICVNTESTFQCWDGKSPGQFGCVGTNTYRICQEGLGYADSPELTCPAGYRCANTAGKCECNTPGGCEGLPDIGRGVVPDDEPAEATNFCHIRYTNQDGTQACRTGTDLVLASACTANDNYFGGAAALSQCESDAAAANQNRIDTGSGLNSIENNCTFYNASNDSCTTLGNRLQSACQGNGYFFGAETYQRCLDAHPGATRGSSDTGVVIDGTASCSISLPSAGISELLTVNESICINDRLAATCLSAQNVSYTGCSDGSVCQSGTCVSSENLIPPAYYNGGQSPVQCEFSRQKYEVGQTFCVSGSVATCQADGTYYGSIQACPEGQTCSQGGCVESTAGVVEIVSTSDGGDNEVDETVGSQQNQAAVGGCGLGLFPRTCGPTCVNKGKLRFNCGGLDENIIQDGQVVGVPPTAPPAAPEETAPNCDFVGPFFQGNCDDSCQRGGQRPTIFLSCGGVRVADETQSEQTAPQVAGPTITGGSVLDDPDLLAENQADCQTTRVFGYDCPDYCNKKDRILSPWGSCRGVDTTNDSADAGEQTTCQIPGSYGITDAEISVGETRCYSARQFVSCENNLFGPRLVEKSCTSGQPCRCDDIVGDGVLPASSCQYNGQEYQVDDGVCEFNTSTQQDGYNVCRANGQMEFIPCTGSSVCDRDGKVQCISISEIESRASQNVCTSVGQCLDGYTCTYTDVIVRRERAAGPGCQVSTRPENCNTPGNKTYDLGSTRCLNSDVRTGYEFCSDAGVMEYISCGEGKSCVAAEDGQSVECVSTAELDEAARAAEFRQTAEELSDHGCGLGLPFRACRSNNDDFVCQNQTASWSGSCGGSRPAARTPADIVGQLIDNPDLIMALRPANCGFVGFGYEGMCDERCNRAGRPPIFGSCGGVAVEAESADEDQTNVDERQYDNPGTERDITCRQANSETSTVSCPEYCTREEASPGATCGQYDPDWQGTAVSSDDFEVCQAVGQCVGNFECTAFDVANDNTVGSSGVVCGAEACQFYGVEISPGTSQCAGGEWGQLRLSCPAAGGSGSSDVSDSLIQAVCPEGTVCSEAADGNATCVAPEQACVFNHRYVEVGFESCDLGEAQWSSYVKCTEDGIQTFECGEGQDSCFDFNGSPSEWCASRDDGTSTVEPACTYYGEGMALDEERCSVGDGQWESYVKCTEDGLETISCGQKSDSCTNYDGSLSEWCQSDDEGVAVDPEELQGAVNQVLDRGCGIGLPRRACQSNDPAYECVRDIATLFGSCGGSQIKVDQQAAEEFAELTGDAGQYPVKEANCGFVGFGYDGNCPSVCNRAGQSPTLLGFCGGINEAAQGQTTSLSGDESLSQSNSPNVGNFCWAIHEESGVCTALAGIQSAEACSTWASNSNIFTQSFWGRDADTTCRSVVENQSSRPAYDPYRAMNTACAAVNSQTSTVGCPDYCSKDQAQPGSTCGVVDQSLVSIVGTVDNPVDSQDQIENLTNQCTLERNLGSNCPDYCTERVATAENDGTCGTLSTDYSQPLDETICRSLGQCINNKECTEFEVANTLTATRGDDCGLPSQPPVCSINDREYAPNTTFCLSGTATGECSADGRLTNMGRSCNDGEECIQGNCIVAPYGDDQISEEEDSEGSLCITNNPVTNENLALEQDQSICIELGSNQYSLQCSDAATSTISYTQCDSDQECNIETGVCDDIETDEGDDLPATIGALSNSGAGVPNYEATAQGISYRERTGDQYSQLDYSGELVCDGVDLGYAGCGVFVTAQVLGINPRQAAEYFCPGGQNQYVGNVGEIGYISEYGTSIESIRGVLTGNGVTVGQSQRNISSQYGADYAVSEVAQYTESGSTVIATIDHVVCASTFCRIIGHQILIQGVQTDGAGNTSLSVSDSVYSGDWRVCDQDAFDVNTLGPEDEGCAIIKHIAPIVGSNNYEQL